MSAEIHELGATRKKEDRVQEESNFKEGVYQSQESKTVKEGVTSARGSRPVFVKEMSSVKVKIGEMSEFTCQFHGDPLPTVTWLKDGHPLAHNLDYDTIRKSNKSTLTIFYPTTDHEGTYDCVITNKHGKSICTATLEISDKKVVRRSGATQEVVVTGELDKGEENQESLMEEELQSYMESGKATLQVPQAVIHRRHCSDESLSSSTVEIRITAATPVPEMTEENTDDKPQAFTENPSGVPNNTAVLECVITGEPAAEVEWYCNDIRLELTGGKYRVEVDDKVYRLYINSFTYTDAGVYKCVARNRLGEVTSISDVSFQVAEPLQFSKRGGAVEDDVFHKAGITYTKSLPQAPSEVAVKEFEKQVKIITIPEYTADNKSMIISLDVLPSIYEEGAVDFVTQEHDELKIAFEVTEMPPRFINPICDMEAPEGTTVMFECSLMGIPSPIVSWFKGDKKVPHNNKKYLHSSDGDNHFLKICKVSTQDSGVYTCRAINVVGETLCRASLVVLSAKTFSGKTRGRELTAVSLGSAKVQPQKFDLMVGNTSFDGEQPGLPSKCPAFQSQLFNGLTMEQYLRPPLCIS
uniref:Ig-like domain-containing protein n=1 Tax=Seriola dumerili TaxID=41447 RepID=A0A3B4TDW9_SERDU